MNTKKLIEEIDNVNNEDIYNYGTNMSDHKWTERILERKTVDFLGVQLPYVKIEFSVEDADPSDMFEQTRTYWELDERKLDKSNLLKEINSKIAEQIFTQLGVPTNAYIGGGVYITIPTESIGER